MLNFVSMNAIRQDFDAAIEKQGYVRAKVMCDKWGITTDKLSKAIKNGYVCDCFMVHNVRYISVNAEKPEEV